MKRSVRPSGPEEPILEALAIASIGAQGERGEDRQPLGMLVAIDPDALPGLRHVFERHREGESFDVLTQWRVSINDDIAVSPIVFLYLSLPAVALDFNVAFDLDESKRSLAVAARTGLVRLCEPELLLALKTEDPLEAMEKYLSFEFPATEVEPLRRALQQRFDVPLHEHTVPHRVVEPGGGREAALAFIGSAEPPDAVAFLPALGIDSLVVVVDQKATSVVESLRDGDELLANWAALIPEGGHDPLARLDVLASGRRLRSWLLVDPSIELIRCTSAGPHDVMVVTEDVFEDPDKLWDQIERARRFRVPVAPEAMRALLR